MIIWNINDDYRKTAEEDGFVVYNIDEVVKKCDIIMLLIPDESHKFIYET